jgi:hypothetical protein
MSKCVGLGRRELDICKSHITALVFFISERKELTAKVDSLSAALKVVEEKLRVEEVKAQNLQENLQLTADDLSKTRMLKNQAERTVATTSTQLIILESESKKEITMLNERLNQLEDMKFENLGKVQILQKLVTHITVSWMVRSFKWRKAILAHLMLTHDLQQMVYKYEQDNTQISSCMPDHLEIKVKQRSELRVFTKSRPRTTIMLKRQEAELADLRSSVGTILGNSTKQGEAFFQRNLEVAGELMDAREELRRCKARLAGHNAVVQAKDEAYTELRRKHALLQYSLQSLRSPLANKSSADGPSHSNAGSGDKLGFVKQKALPLPALSGAVPRPNYGKSQIQIAPGLGGGGGEGSSVRNVVSTKYETSYAIGRLTVTALCPIPYQPPQKSPPSRARIPATPRWASRAPAAARSS